jgi:predicted nucleic acid-binding protein
MVPGASVLIGFLDGDDAHHARATALLLSHLDEELAASVVTLAEVLVGSLRRDTSSRSWRPSTTSGSAASR